MTVHAYEVTLNHGATHTVRKIIAHNSMQAGRIGLMTSPANKPLRGLICKPYHITNEKEPTPCAA